MQIIKNSVVSFYYHLRDESGKELEHSHDREPNIYLHGHRGIMPTLEEAMAGKEVGDEFSVTLTPQQAFGLRQEGSQQRVPMKHLVGNTRPKVGEIASIQTDKGPRQVVVLKVGMFNLDVDTNHPLAGKTVTFDINIVDIREATAEELAHGHAHGPAGHNH